MVAGAIIGKGGETIAQLQKDTGARVKMSKSHDFYPGIIRFDDMQNEHEEAIVYNMVHRVTHLVPGGWLVEGCGNNAGWSCSKEIASVRGGWLQGEICQDL
ncbi:unnamed protein product [Leptidea sinapis]|uniref:K Homology domain-containing protein n=1 Tax=Leptidea sinapis TaxID=189913 RepID=A0A5E4QW47_9NEOP|nr:unnamed protein product [Leptidea sinapis]